MKGTLNSMQMDRRSFLAFGVTGFTLLLERAIAGPPQKTDSSPLPALDTIVIKNPAYQKYKIRGNVFLKTRTSTGDDIVYRVDKRGESAFDLAVNVREYHQGKGRTTGEILTGLNTLYPQDDRELQKSDYLSFVNATLAAGILMTTDHYVWSTYVEG